MSNDAGLGSLGAWPTTGVGRRVAEERKLAGLTHAQLATHANVSTSLIKVVEQGRSPAFVSAVSRALHVGFPSCS
ncbi:MAG: helix-turn-helix transcriptional regulator, partial [Actinomycetota bacterium]|nr:helix-turn-helix transcriptional regulator [Actinomycetota bacterium]